MSFVPTVLIKGAGEIATGVAHCLHRAHFRVALTDISQPLAVRRAVSFCEAVYEGRKVVEEVEAVRIDHPDEILPTWSQAKVPLIVDPEFTLPELLRPQVVIEATLAKRNTGLNPGMAPLVIALGPGFEAGVDAHLVVETNRGHHLGRLYREGFADANTGIPGNIGGYTKERVLRAPADGILETDREIGDQVEAGQAVAMVAGVPSTAQVSGIVRGLIRPGTQVTKGLKIGDVDPRGDPSHVHTISDKARALGGAVLAAILMSLNQD